MGIKFDRALVALKTTQKIEQATQHEATLIAASLLGMMATTYSMTQDECREASDLISKLEKKPPLQDLQGRSDIWNRAKKIASAEIGHARDIGGLLEELRDIPENEKSALLQQLDHFPYWSQDDLNRLETAAGPKVAFEFIERRSLWNVYLDKMPFAEYADKQDDILRVLVGNAKDLRNNRIDTANPDWAAFVTKASPHVLTAIFPLVKEGIMTLTPEVRVHALSELHKKMQLQGVTEKDMKRFVNDFSDAEKLQLFFAIGKDAPHDLYWNTVSYIKWDRNTAEFFKKYAEHVTGYSTLRQNALWASSLQSDPTVFASCLRLLDPDTKAVLKRSLEKQTNMAKFYPEHYQAAQEALK